MSLMMIVEKFGGAFLGILAGSAVIRMFYEILNYVSSFLRTQERESRWRISLRNLEVDF